MKKSVLKKCFHPRDKVVGNSKCTVCGTTFPPHRWVPSSIPGRLVCANCYLAQRLDGNESPCGIYEPTEIPDEAPKE